MGIDGRNTGYLASAAYSLNDSTPDRAVSNATSMQMGAAAGPTGPGGAAGELCWKAAYVGGVGEAPNPASGDDAAA